MENAYKSLGISIISGGCVSILSVSFLALAKMVVYRKVCYMVVTTVLNGMIVSLFLFGSLAHLVGPQDESCIVGLFQRFFARFKPNKVEPENDLEGF